MTSKCGENPATHCPQGVRSLGCREIITDPSLSYISFIRENWRLLIFGVAMSLFASPGQTYYISIFGEAFRDEFGLSDGDLGDIYAIATITSAASMIWLGRWIDRLDLRLYACLVCASMTAAAYFTSTVTSVFGLWFAVYALRLFGQGLMVHTSVTTMGRYFSASRGRAIAVALLGNTLGVAAYPIMGVALIAWLGWRQAWWVLGLAYLLFLIPLILWLLKGHKPPAQSAARPPDGKPVDPAAKTDPAVKPDRKVGGVLRDPVFYFMLPAMMAPSFVLTGFIFHQTRLVESKGWSLTVYASGYAGFAIASFATSLVFGALIDRFGARRMFPYFLLPTIVSMPIIAVFDHELAGLAFLIGSGSGLGATLTIYGAIWAEIYGTSHLGAIRSLAQSIMIFASALSPSVFGRLMDQGFSLESIAWGCLVFLVIALLMAKVSTVVRVASR